MGFIWEKDEAGRPVESVPSSMPSRQRTGIDRGYVRIRDTSKCLTSCFQVQACQAPWCCKTGMRRRQLAHPRRRKESEQSSWQKHLVPTNSSLSWEHL